MRNVASDPIRIAHDPKANESHKLPGVKLLSPSKLGHSQPKLAHLGVITDRTPPWVPAVFFAQSRKEPMAWNKSGRLNVTHTQCSRRFRLRQQLHR
jgi:hypothetical protein